MNLKLSMVIKMTDFEKEYQKYSVDDLELIINTQQELYTDEEKQCLINLLNKKKEKVKIEQIKKFPKEFQCPKCDAIIPSKSKECPFCKYKFKQSDYDNALKCLESDNEEKSSGNIASYIFSFLIPLVGLILGPILISKDDEDKKESGIICIIIAIISIIISSIISYNFLFK